MLEHQESENKPSATRESEPAQESVAAGMVQVEVEESTRQADAPIPLLHGGGDTRVLIHNDEVTPFDYVIDTLNSIFMLSDEIAEHVAWTAHTYGTAVVVVRPRPEAEKLAKAAHARAKFAGFPLTFTLEAE